MYCCTIRTTGLAGGLHCAYKAPIPAALKAPESLPSAPGSQAAPKGAYDYLPLPYCSPVNGSTTSLIVSCSYSLSSFS